MRFSLKSMLVLVAGVSLTLGLIATQIQLRRTRQDLEQTQRSYNVLHQDEEQDRYRLITTGGKGDEVFIGSSLIRIQHFEKYRLNAVFYDSETEQRQHEQYPLAGPEVVITYLPSQHGDSIFIQGRSLNSGGTGYMNEFFRMAGGTSFSINPNPRGAEGPVNGAPILWYFYYPTKDYAEEGPNGAELNIQSETDLTLVCNKHRLRCAYFYFSPR